ncbi:hypothetical protein FACS1894186_5170 [Alphaproteobacteria bacterium]|nr:hypothetical protein FACS1894186_5170 [Alphaproteobacteria bacterium]
MLYMIAILFVMIGIAFYSMNPRDDDLETKEYPQALAAVMSMSEHYKAAIKHANCCLCLNQGGACYPPSPGAFCQTNPAAYCGASDYPKAISLPVQITTEMLGVPPGDNWLPMGYIDKPAVKTYAFCINKSDGMLANKCDEAMASPAADATVRDYIITVYDIPFRYDAKGRKELLVNAIRKYISSQPIGVVEKSSPTLQNNADGTANELVGSTHFIRHPGTSAYIYIPNAIACNAAIFPTGLTGKIVAFGTPGKARSNIKMRNAAALAKSDPNRLNVRLGMPEGDYAVQDGADGTCN